MICILFGFLILMFAAHFVINPIAMAIIARSLGWSGEAQRYLSHVNKMGRTASPVYGRYYTDSRTQWVYRLVVLLWAVLLIGAPFFKKGQEMLCGVADLGLIALSYAVRAAMAIYDLLSPALN